MCAFPQSFLSDNRDPTEIRCYLWPLSNNKRKSFFCLTLAFDFLKVENVPQRLKKKKKERKAEVLSILDRINI